MLNADKISFFDIPNVQQCFTTNFKGEEYLLPEERKFVEQAAPKRRADFSTGRYCARQALAALINTQPPILQGANRQPLWPDGVVGSISHSTDLAGAVVALKKDVTAIGIDIETIGGIKADMWVMIFHDSEQQLIQSKGDEADVWATLIFSLKEAFYKLQFPLTGRFVDFLDVCIVEEQGNLHLESEGFLTNSQLIVLTELKMEWKVIKNQLLSICYIVAK